MLIAMLAALFASLCTAGICRFAWRPEAQPAAPPRDASPGAGIDGTAALLGILASQAAAGRSNANESAAIAALKCISSAQAQAQASAVIDVNHNDAGEYCFLAELAGAKGVRSDEVGGVSRSIITPPVMSSAFGTVVGSRVMRCGYWFQMYLPGPDGTGVAENPNGGGEGCRVAAGKAEVVWCCYAWPVECGASGKRAFFVNQAGDVLAADNATARYNGTAGVPSAGAAFRAGTKGHLDDAVAANAAGVDGETWLVVD